jgi:hypothetical protein
MQIEVGPILQLKHPWSNVNFIQIIRQKNQHWNFEIILSIQQKHSKIPFQQMIFKILGFHYMIPRFQDLRF